MSKKVLYEINTRYWIYQLRQKYTEHLNIGNIPDQELDIIALHFDWVWLMGVWDHSDLDKEFIDTHPGLISETVSVLEDWTEEDIIGSPYSIKSYLIHPFLGSDKDFTVLKKRFNDRGVKVMVDFVPNHFGYKTDLVTNHPDYFINLKEAPHDNDRYLFKCVETTEGPRWIAHGRDPYFAPWDDTFQVNIFHPQMRRYMIDQLIHLSSISDGVRCDMAMLVNNNVFENTWDRFLKDDKAKPAKEFWEMAIQESKAKNQDFIFLAEVYWDLEYEMLELGFDYCYDKRLYDRIIQSRLQSIRKHLSADFSYQSKMCRFIENHDEPRALNKMNYNQSLAAITIILTLPGLSLIHQGQMIGLVKKIPVQLRRKDKEVVNKSLQRKYIQLLNFVTDQIQSEYKWVFNQVTADHKNLEGSIFSWSWFSPEKYVVIIINYSAMDASGFVQLDLTHSVFDSAVVEFYEYVSAETYPWHISNLQEEGLYVDLHGYQYHLFTVHTI